MKIYLAKVGPVAVDSRLGRTAVTVDRVGSILGRGAGLCSSTLQSSNRDGGSSSEEAGRRTGVRVVVLGAIDALRQSRTKQSQGGREDGGLDCHVGEKCEDLTAKVDGSIVLNELFLHEDNPQQSYIVFGCSTTRSADANTPRENQHYWASHSPLRVAPNGCDASTSRLV